MKKAYKDCAKSTQAKRLREYAKADAKSGTETMLVTVFRGPVIKPVADFTRNQTVIHGAKRVSFLLRHYDKATDAADMFWASTLVLPTQTSLMAYYQAVKRSDLKSVRIKRQTVNDRTWINLWSMFDRQKPAKTAK